MMREFSGMELYEEVIRKRPELASRFVFITGGSYTERTSNFLGSVKTADEAVLGALVVGGAGGGLEGSLTIP
jgi:hypothetical protein